MLARKSRKNRVEKETVKCDLLKAAGYVRLSVNKDAHPSDSVKWKASRRQNSFDFLDG